MSRTQKLIPAYRLHKARGQAVVTLSGRDFYLGPYDSEQSHAEYQRRLGKWLANGRRLEVETAPAAFSINQLMLAYLEYAERFYRDAQGQPTREVQTMVLALRPLKALFGFTPAGEFGPLALKSVRHQMIEADLCRKTINQRMGYIKRMFAWGASEELIPPALYHGLLSVRGLQAFRGGARETTPVLPVPDAYVDAIVPYLVPTLRCMLMLHRLTGMRSGELVQMRSGDIDTSGEIWLYRPPKHKTRWRGKERVIPLGPQCQDAIRPFLKLDTAAPLFNPRQANAERNAAKRALRKAPVQPSQVSRARLNPKRKAGGCYDTRSYFRALRYAMERATRAGALAKEHFWHPHQLRHSAALRVQREHGLEAARAFLGHAKPDMTAMYAGMDTALAIQVAGASA